MAEKISGLVYEGQWPEHKDISTYGDGEGDEGVQNNNAKTVVTCTKTLEGVANL